MDCVSLKLPQITSHWIFNIQQVLFPTLCFLPFLLLHNTSLLLLLPSLPSPTLLSSPNCSHCRTFNCINILLLLLHHYWESTWWQKLQRSKDLNMPKISIRQSSLKKNITLSLRLICSSLHFQSQKSLYSGLSLLGWNASIKVNNIMPTLH